MADSNDSPLYLIEQLQRANTLIDNLRAANADLRAKLAEAEQREAELHTVMAACLPHWIDPEAGIPLTDAATFQMINAIALRMESCAKQLGEDLTIAQARIADLEAEVKGLSEKLIRVHRITDDLKLATDQRILIIAEAIDKVLAGPAPAASERAEEHERRRARGQS